VGKNGAGWWVRMARVIAPRRVGAQPQAPRRVGAQPQA
jgi:hypothetical protein